MSHPGFVSRLNDQDRELYEKKVAVAGFYRQNRIPEEMEKALNRLFFKQPEDVHGYLVGMFFFLCVSLGRKETSIFT